MKKKSHFGLLMKVFEKGVRKQLKDTVPLLLVLLKSLLDEIHSLPALYLGELDLRTHLSDETRTTFCRSFLLRILKGI